MRRKLLAGIVALPFLAAPFSPALAQQQSDQEFMKWLQGTANDYAGKMNAHDEAKVAALYTDDAVLVSPMGFVSGKAAIEKGLAMAIKNNVRDFAVTFHEAHVVNADTAWATGNLRQYGLAEQPGPTSEGLLDVHLSS
jgi:ketosteroid isomerase-like protein